MKRGPSKGYVHLLGSRLSIPSRPLGALADMVHSYIKELSERVQQVESLQMQLAGQPAGIVNPLTQNTLRTSHTLLAGATSLSLTTETPSQLTLETAFRVQAAGAWAHLRLHISHETPEAALRSLQISILVISTVHWSATQSLSGHTTPKWKAGQRSDRRRVATTKWAVRSPTSSRSLSLCKNYFP